MPTVTCPGCGRSIPLADNEMHLTIQCAGCGVKIVPPPRPGGSAEQRQQSSRVFAPPDEPVPAPAPDYTHEPIVTRGGAPPAYFYFWASFLFACMSVAIIMGLLFYIEARIRLAAAAHEVREQIKNIRP